MYMGKACQKGVEPCQCEKESEDKVNMLGKWEYMQTDPWDSTRTLYYWWEKGSYRQMWRAYTFWANGDYEEEVEDRLVSKPFLGSDPYMPDTRTRIPEPSGQYVSNLSYWRSGGYYQWELNGALRLIPWYGDCGTCHPEVWEVEIILSHSLTQPDSLIMDSERYVGYSFHRTKTSVEVEKE